MRRRLVSPIITGVIPGQKRHEARRPRAVDGSMMPMIIISLLMAIITGQWMTVMATAALRRAER